MAQYDRYRDRYRNDDDRRERNHSGEEYYRREYRPYAISEYAGGQYEYGRGVEDEAAGNRAAYYRSGRDSDRWPRLRDNRNSDYDAGSANYGTAPYGTSVYGENGGYTQYMGGGTYGEGGVGGYGNSGYQEGRDYNRSLGIEEPALGGRFRHFNDRPRARYQPRDMWDRASDEVASWFGDEDAAHRRRLDNFRGRGPKNYNRSSDRIRDDVSDRLTDDWQVDASDIDVSVEGTEVTLDGTVHSREAKRRAEDCADSVSGVSHVQNNLRVKA